MRLIKWQQHFPVERNALARFNRAALRGEHGGLVVENVENLWPVRARLLLHFIDAAETFRHDEAGLHALAFEQRVRAHRRAVAEVCDVGGLHAARDQQVHAGQNGAGGVIGRRGNLGDGHFFGRFVEVDEV